MKIIPKIRKSGFGSNPFFSRREEMTTNAARFSSRCLVEKWTRWQESKRHHSPLRIAARS
jgi:hypothetical protein